MEFPGFSLQGEEKDEARLPKHDLKLCVYLTRSVQSVSSSDISVMISTVHQSPRFPISTRHLHHPRFLSTIPASSPPSPLPPHPASSTTPRPPQPRVLHNPSRYKATLPSHMCSECLCFGYVYPASTLSVCIRLTWGLKRQITHPLHHSLPLRVITTILAPSPPSPRPLHHLRTLPYPASATIHHHPPRYKATLPSHMCSECLCFGYVYPASTLSVCIRLTWGLKRQITHLMLDQVKLSTTLHHPRPLYHPRVLHHPPRPPPSTALQGYLAEPYVF
jgi:hypothetical protein